jgi:hypothetical protein
MSCVEITVEMAELLEAMRAWPVPDEVLEYWRDSETWLTAIEWGWMMESGALTGMGLRHADPNPPRGILPPGL